VARRRCRSFAGGAPNKHVGRHLLDRQPVRMVLGVASLPLGMPVELEVILEVAE
jgi:enamine deaminase RidA (YjgF/YER057c/UK114 family)